MLEIQARIRAFSRAWAKTGKSMAARLAIIAITTRSSMSVKAGFRIRGIDDLPVLAPIRPQPAEGLAGRHPRWSEKSAGCCLAFRWISATLVEAVPPRHKV